MTDPNEQAFPRSYATGLMNEVGQHELKSIPGITKREYFAAMAMQGAEASLKWPVPSAALAEHAVKCADALIVELNKKRNLADEPI